AASSSRASGSPRRAPTASRRSPPWRPSRRPALFLAAQVGEVGVVVGLAAEEGLHQRALLGAASAREHEVAPGGGGGRVQEPLGLEARQHVAREGERPLVAV